MLTNMAKGNVLWTAISRYRLQHESIRALEEKVPCWVGTTDCLAANNSVCPVKEQLMRHMKQ